MSRVGVAVCAVGALAVAGWLAFEAHSATFMYTRQGDLCEHLRSRIEKQQPLPRSPTLSTCVERHDTVYRAFLLELGVALGGSALGVRWLIRALRAGSNRE